MCCKTLLFPIHTCATAGTTCHTFSTTQARAYNHYLPAVRSEWLAIWDADEYVFGPNVTVGSHLRSLPPTTRQV